jgi:four helix bundle protein
MTIAYKEARETRYWLRLLKESALVNVELRPYLLGVEELNRILSSITKTTKNLKSS